MADFVDGSRAGRAAAVASLSPAGAQAASRGDVLRAFTASTVSFGPRAQLLGDLSGSKRAVVLFGADGQSWTKTTSALTSGLVADGPVTLCWSGTGPGARQGVDAGGTPQDDPRVPQKDRSRGSRCPVVPPKRRVRDEEAEEESNVLTRSTTPFSPLS